MLTMDKVHFIRQLYYEQGKNIPDIIAETGYDRKTICKYIDMTDFGAAQFYENSRCHDGKYLVLFSVSVKSYAPPKF